MNYKLNYSQWGKQEISAINKVVKSSYLTMGKNVNIFEKQFASYLGRKYAVMVNSGSSANLLSLASLFYKKKKPLKANDEVIVPAIAWSTTYSPLQQYGLKIKIVDISLKDLNVDIDKILSAITKKTKMIVAVNILGFPAELKKMRDICKKKNIYLFEDNCEALGAKIGKEKTGTFGILSSHSFFFSHHISTIEGGMVTTNDYELYCLMKSIRAHGWSRDLPTRNNLNFSKKKGLYEQYNFILPGYNLRSTEISAAIGIEQLKKLKYMIYVRNKNLKLFQKLFKNDKRFIIQKTEHTTSSFSFPMIFKKKVSKKFKYRFFDILKKNNINFRLITGGCFTEHPYKKYFNYEIYKNVNNAKKAHNDGFFVGNASRDLTKEINKFFMVIKDIK